MFEGRLENEINGIPKLLVAVSALFVSERLSSVSSAEANLGGHTFKDDSAVATVVTRWLIK
jgi:hypothetical protein